MTTGAPPALPGVAQRLRTGGAPQVLERLPRDAQLFELRPAGSADDTKRVRLYRPVAGVKCAVVECTEAQPVARVVGPACRPWADMGGLQQVIEVQLADGALGSVPLDHSEAEPAMPRSDFANELAAVSLDDQLERLVDEIASLVVVSRRA